MSDALMLEFTGVTEQQYQAVNTLLGIDARTGAGDWPRGLLDHTGATSPDGSLVVFEVWDSQQSQLEFMNSRLGHALSEAGVPAPSRVQWFSVVGQTAPGAHTARTS
ncbi:MAG TPA: hypothetical protein VMB79_04490 [Jatrophihabitans sp.]|nr:hypothetical protein [Jatrophihabitans sp.]